MESPSPPLHSKITKYHLPTLDSFCKIIKIVSFLPLNMGQWDQCSLNARLIKKNSFAFSYGDLQLPHGTTHKKRSHSTETLPSYAAPCALWLMESCIMPNKITLIETRWKQRNALLDNGATALPSPLQRMVGKSREDQKEEFNTFFPSFLVVLRKKAGLWPHIRGYISEFLQSVQQHCLQYTWGLASG